MPAGRSEDEGQLKPELIISFVCEFLMICFFQIVCVSEFGSAIRRYAFQ